MVYAAEQDAGTTLQPGQRVPLDLVLPIADPSQLILDVELEDEAPLRMVLLRILAAQEQPDDPDRQVAGKEDD